MTFQEFSETITYGSMDEINRGLRDIKDINEVPPRHEKTFLSQAVSSGNMNMVILFVQKGAEINMENSNGYTPLFEGVYESFDMVKYLCKKGADVNHQNKYRDSPLTEALKAGEIKSFKEMLKYNPDYFQKDSIGNTLLDLMKDEKRLKKLYKEIFNSIRAKKVGKFARLLK